MTHDELLQYENTPGIKELISSLIKVYDAGAVDFSGRFDRANGFDYTKRYDFLCGRSIKDIVHGLTEDGRDAKSFLNVLKALTVNEKTGSVSEIYLDFAENCPGGEEQVRGIFDLIIDFFYSGKYSGEEPCVRERMIYYLNVIPGLERYLSDGSAARALECACLLSGAAKAGGSLRMEEFYDVAVESLIAILAHSEKGRKLLLQKLKTAYTEEPAFADEALAAITGAGIRDEDIYKALRSLVKAEKDAGRLLYLLDCVEIYGDPRAVSFLRTRALAMRDETDGGTSEDGARRKVLLRMLYVIEALGGNTEL